MTENNNKCFRCNKSGVETEYCDECIYGDTGILTFGEAVELMKQGKKVKRNHWGGYWFIPQNHIVLSENDGEHEVGVMNQTIIARLKHGGGYVVATPYQADILAEDWNEVE